VTLVTVDVPAALSGGTAGSTAGSTAGGSGRGRFEVALGESASPATVADVLDALAQQRPALERRLRDETGQVRRFVNLYVDGADVRGSAGVQTPVRDGAELLVIPSVAGG
jgi:sulfur-carrier protein